MEWLPVATNFALRKKKTRVWYLQTHMLNTQHYYRTQFRGYI